MYCSVHRYKYSQDRRRAKLKRMKKLGILKLINVSKTHFECKILDMEEYKKRK